MKNQNNKLNQITFVQKLTSKWFYNNIYLINVLINIIINSTDTEYTVADALPGTSFSVTASVGCEEETNEYYYF